MERFRILRIVLMIVCIFAAGIGIGYQFIPRPDPDVTLKVALGREGKDVSADTIVEYYDRELHLTGGQKTVLRDLAAEFVQKIAATQPRTKTRHDIFRAYSPKVRALLQENQLGRFDELTQEHRERMERYVK